MFVVVMSSWWCFLLWLDIVGVFVDYIIIVLSNCLVLVVGNIRSIWLLWFLMGIVCYVFFCFSIDDVMV